MNGDGRAELITGGGPRCGPHVKVFGADTDEPLRSFYAFDASFSGGVMVG